VAGRATLLMVVLLAVYIAVPRLVEQTFYAATRGRQRAESEAAARLLSDVNASRLSQGSQLVSARVAPSVVQVVTERAAPEWVDEDDLDEVAIPQGTDHGSGIVMDGDGYILTNYHVIEDASRCQVLLADGRQLPGVVIGYDALSDLAVIRVKASNLIPVVWGDSDELEVGSLVWAVGSPYGLDHSVTMGIVSAKHRAGKAGNVFQDFLQTDAAVNPGNSGGPLVDAQGRVVGVNSMILGYAYQGISFAIPSNLALPVYEKLKAGERVERGYLGVRMAALTPKDAVALGLATTAGVLVKGTADAGDTLDHLVPSPALRAGVKPNDVIVEWNGHRIEEPMELSLLVAHTAAGTIVPMTIIRDGSTMALKVHVGTRPEEVHRRRSIRG
ncbi:MAG: trypsin-like peptidase domain-containing protein, partial [Planctomycetales bacterium]|nr:trypsin-like peptidase domain-containing protein [Planctomycetales bacterium]